MKKICFVVAILSALVASAAPRKVALVVQNHTSDMDALPMAAFADTLAAKLSGEAIRVFNGSNQGTL